MLRQQGVCENVSIDENLVPVPKTNTACLLFFLAQMTSFDVLHRNPRMIYYDFKKRWFSYEKKFTYITLLMTISFVPKYSCCNFYEKKMR